MRHVCGQTKSELDVINKFDKLFNSCFTLLWFIQFREEVQNKFTVIFSNLSFNFRKLILVTV